MTCKRVFIFLFSILTTLSSYGQSGEQGNDCTYSKEVIIPFNYSDKPGNVNAKPLLNQTVFYSHRDQFTYWYKIIVKENSILNFKVSALNDSDTYAVFVYQYNQPDFCNKLFYGKITYVKPGFFVKKNAMENPYDLSPKSFSAIKGNTYYISVLNTSLHNCGHNFRLINATDTLKVKALHLPCERDVASLTLKPATTNKQLKNQDTIKIKIISPTYVQTDSVKTNTLVCYVKDIKKKSPLKASPVIINDATGEALQLTSPEEGEWRCTVEKEKTYKIKCTSIGYKKTEQTVKINTAFTKLTILMEPLKAGDNFVMKSIYFYPNTYALKKESADELQKLFDFLSENENVTIEIQGHTNGDHHIIKNKAYASLGEEWNFQGSAKELSQKRAEAIKTYLENNGIKQDRLKPKGYGGKKPIIKDPQDNEEGQMNIRVEIVILKS